MATRSMTVTSRALKRAAAQYFRGQPGSQVVADSAKRIARIGAQIEHDWAENRTYVGSAHLGWVGEP